MFSNIDLSGIALPKDWYKLPLSNNKQHTIYANIKLGICSLSPVFELKSMDQILGNYLGWQYDLTVLQKQIDKLRGQLNVNANNSVLINNELVTRTNEEQRIENEKINSDLENIFENLDKRIYSMMCDSLFNYNEEVSLLNQISYEFYQCQALYEYVDRLTDNPKLRYYCSVKLNGKEVGRGVAQSKKKSKILASRQAIKILSPSLYEEWLEKNNKNNDDQMDISDEESKVEVAYTAPIVTVVAKQQKNGIQYGQDGNVVFEDAKNPEVKPLQAQKIVATTATIIISTNQDTPIMMVNDDISILQLQSDGDQIDDPELMGSKRHLTTKFTPLTIIKSLQDKHRTLSIEEETSQYKHTLNNQPIFVSEFALKNQGIVGRDENMNKAKARQMAAQRFLKNLFPPGYTWQQVVALVSSSREPLATFMDVNQ